MIKVRGLTKSFAGQPVLRGVDLDVPDGSITVIIGRSGGGKSVFLKHLLGLLRPDSGEVMINGTDITQLGTRAMDEVRRRLVLHLCGPCYRQWIEDPTGRA